MISDQGAVNVKYMDLQQSMDAVLSWSCKVTPRMSNNQGVCYADKILIDSLQNIYSSPPFSRFYLRDHIDLESRRRSCRKYYWRNREKEIARVKAYRLKNKERLSIQAKERYRKKKENRT